VIDLWRDANVFGKQRTIFGGGKYAAVRHAVERAALPCRSSPFGNIMPWGAA
jgi:hypothetical protein